MKPTMSEDEDDGRYGDAFGRWSSAEPAVDADREHHRGCDRENRTQQTGQECRLATSDHHAWAAERDRQWDVLRTGQDERLGRRCRTSARSLPPPTDWPVSAGCASGSRCGAADRSPMPKPGIAALPQAASASEPSLPAARAAATSASTSGSSSQRRLSTRSAEPGSDKSEKGTARR